MDKFGAVELFHQAMGWNTSQLRINRTETRLLSHEYFLACACNHRTAGHGELWHERPYVCLKHGAQVIDDGFDGSRIAARGVQDKIEADIALHLMNDGHESVLVIIVDLYARQVASLKPT